MLPSTAINSNPLDLLCHHRQAEKPIYFCNYVIPACIHKMHFYTLCLIEFWNPYIMPKPQPSAHTSCIYKNVLHCTPTLYVTCSD